jgi:hypothetical protein
MPRYYVFDGARIITDQSIPVGEILDEVPEETKRSIRERYERFRWPMPSFLNTEYALPR